MKTGEIMEKFLAINILAFAVLEIMIFATGIDMIYPSVGERVIFIVVLGMPYFLLFLGLILLESEWVKMLFTLCCIVLTVFAAIAFVTHVQGITSLLMEAYAIIIIFTSIMFLCFGDLDFSISISSR